MEEEHDSKMADALRSCAARVRCQSIDGKTQREKTFSWKGLLQRKCTFCLRQAHKTFGIDSKTSKQNVSNKAKVLSIKKLFFHQKFYQCLNCKILQGEQCRNSKLSVIIHDSSFCLLDEMDTEKSSSMREIPAWRTEGERRIYQHCVCYFHCE